MSFDFKLSFRTKFFSTAPLYLQQVCALQVESTLEPTHPLLGALEVIEFGETLVLRLQGMLRLSFPRWLQG